MNILIVFIQFVNGQAKTAAGRSVEVEYWSTLTTRGRRDVAREEEVIAVEVVCISLLFPGR